MCHINSVVGETRFIANNTRATTNYCYICTAREGAARARAQGSPDGSSSMIDALRAG